MVNSVYITLLRIGVGGGGGGGGQAPVVPVFGWVSASVHRWRKVGIFGTQFTLSKSWSLVSTMSNPVDCFQFNPHLMLIVIETQGPYG